MKKIPHTNYNAPPHTHKYSYTYAHHTYAHDSEERYLSLWLTK